MKIRIHTVLLILLVLGSFWAGRGSVKPETNVVTERLGTLLQKEDLVAMEPYGPQEMTVSSDDLRELEIPTGYRVALPSFAWVKVQIDSAGHHKVGQECSVSEFGFVEPTKFGNDESILVQYLSPNNESGGARCDPNTLFLMSKAVFDRLRENAIVR